MMNHLKPKFFIKLIKEVQLAFRSRDLPKAVLEVYFRKLSFISNNDFELVVDKIITENKYFPSIADFISKYHLLPKNNNEVTDKSCNEPGCIGGLTYRFNNDTNCGYYFLCTNPYCKARKRYEKARTPDGKRVWLEVPRKGNWQTDQEYWESRSTPADKDKLNSFLKRCGIDPDKFLKRSIQ